MKLIQPAFLVLAAVTIAFASAPEVPLNVTPPEAPPPEEPAPITLPKLNLQLNEPAPPSVAPDGPAECIFQPHPWYPWDLRAKSIEGHATVDFVVGPDGEVVLAHALDVSNEQFGWSAVAAVSKWRFKPAMKDGHAIYAHMQVPIVFSLTEAE